MVSGAGPGFHAMSFHVSRDGQITPATTPTGGPPTTPPEAATGSAEAATGVNAAGAAANANGSQARPPGHPRPPQMVL